MDEIINYYDSWNKPVPKRQKSVIPWFVLICRVQKIMYMSNSDTLKFHYYLQLWSVLETSDFLLTTCQIPYLVESSACDCKVNWKYVTAKIKRRKSRRVGMKEKECSVGRIIILLNLYTKYMTSALLIHIFKSKKQIRKTTRSQMLA